MLKVVSYEAGFNTHRTTQFSKFIPRVLTQPSNLFTQVYLPYLWHFATLFKCHKNHPNKIDASQGNSRVNLTKLMQVRATQGNWQPVYIQHLERTFQPVYIVTFYSNFNSVVCLIVAWFTYVAPCCSKLLWVPLLICRNRHIFTRWGFPKELSAELTMQLKFQKKRQCLKSFANIGRFHMTELNQHGQDVQTPFFKIWITTSPPPFARMTLFVENARLNNLTGLLKPNPYTEVAFQLWSKSSKF